MQTLRMGTKFRWSIVSLVLGLIVAGLPRLSEAAPIYVYKKGKAVTFSSRPPPSGVEAKVFDGRSTGFSTVKTASFSRSSKVYGKNHGHSMRLYSNASFDQYIKEASNEFGVDKSLIRAVIHAESGFNPRAVSPKGAQGLMQLMPGTARMHGVKRSFEPRENIRGGTKYLANLLRRYRGNLTYSIAAYNAGEGAVNQYGGIPPYAETQQYVTKVLALQSRYKNSIRG